MTGIYFDFWRGRRVIANHSSRGPVEAIVVGKSTQLPYCLQIQPVGKTYQMRIHVNFLTFVDESKPLSEQEIIHRLKNPDENFWKDGVAEQASRLLEQNQ